jgi:hypothetical protein
MVDHRAFLTTLQPSLMVGMNDVSNKHLNLKTNDSVNFLFIGDWGVTGINQTMIADQMGIWSQKNNASFVIALGDNFYRKTFTNTLLVLFAPDFSAFNR